MLAKTYTSTIYDKLKQKSQSRQSSHVNSSAGREHRSLVGAAKHEY